MAQVIFLMIFCIPAVLGLSEILYILKMWLISCDFSEEKILLLVPSNENYEQQLVKNAEQIRWNGKNFATRVIVVLTQLDEDKKEKCIDLADELGFEVSEKNELQDKIF